MEINLLLAIFVLLAATVLLVPLFKWAGLGTILGYLAAGVLIGPYGLALVSDTDLIHQIAEFGIVMMLFLIGLEVDGTELWRMRNKVFGLGLTQMAATTVVVALLARLIGFVWADALVVGLALAMSSTAIAMQSVDQRNITKTDTGRASLAILLVQDVAVIPILAIIPLLTTMGGSPIEAIGENVIEAVDNPIDWWIAFVVVGAFAAALLGSRFVIRPLMSWLARTRVPEAFTAFALALVIGAALVTESFGLSPALGAFLGGVLLADSEYRHELESNLQPFKGLLLGLFFITVGMSIAFKVVIENPLLVLALVVALIGLKMLVLFVLATFFKMHVAERLLLAVLLSQAGEFAFVILQFARTAGNLSGPEVELLTVVVALSMATTPFLIFLYDRLWAPRLNRNDDPELPPGPDVPNPHDRVIVLGYGRFGQIVTRLLRAQGFEMTLIDDDPAQIELVKRFGVKVFYGDGGRLEILRAAGADKARMIVIAVAGGERILGIAELIRRNYPDIIVAARAVDRSHAHDLMALGVQVIERETFRAAIKLGEHALVALGRPRKEAHRVAEAFEQHDTRMLHESYAVRHDQVAYIGFVRRSTEMLDAVMKADREQHPEAGHSARRDIDNQPPQASE
ncbi:MAG TPA: monovalent cation:proton antiporter-2 (CPA2) family protein [Devosia sp.]|jgi:glutathione-regulated potassium-efflux system ancillary protein KefC|uniref:monovalent cation:proton antiporter-2 (CPA2) family protein n=1 Tax=Devosia sp. TaxID=1871048 RepID=UPI002DDD8E14|nr:monovalent cation:proton antiporter-2 (CPA2) family protein [Devosia sp.]HEV2514359.1 monovalent cation:proton antiporter-2 (CPA2) family protein [Devosia sp.]